MRAMTAGPKDGDAGSARQLYLVRHGEAAPALAQGAAADPWLAPLTPRGRAQIAELAEALAGRGLDVLAVSAVPRAIETAEILAGRIGLRLVVDEGWNELRPGAVLAGPPEEVRRAVRDAYREAGRPGARFLGGESFAGFARRVELASDRLLARPDWTRAAVVTHEPVVRYMLARCRGLGLAGLGEFEAATGSVSIIDCHAGTARHGATALHLASGTLGDLRRLG